MNHEFDCYAKNYQFINDKQLKPTGETSSYFAELKVKNLIEWYPDLINREIKILDFGCGDGLMTSFLKFYFPKAKIYGIDPSSKIIGTAQQRHSDICFDTLLNQKINFSNNYFDIIIAAGVFHHIPYQEHKIYVDEIFRVLRPTGTFVIFELNPLNIGTRYIFKKSPIEKASVMLWPAYTKHLLYSLGTMRVKYFSFFPKLLRTLRVIEPYIARIPLGGLYAVMVNKR